MIPYSIQNLDAGLTLRAVVYDISDNILAIITTGFTEVFPGEYRWEYQPTQIGYIAFEAYIGSAWVWQAEATVDYTAITAPTVDSESLITPAFAKAMIPGLAAVSDDVVQQMIYAASEWLLHHPYVDPAKVLAYPAIASLVCSKLVQASYNHNLLNGALNGESLGDYSYSVAQGLWAQLFAGPEIAQLLLPMLYSTAPSTRKAQVALGTIDITE